MLAATILALIIAACAAAPYYARLLAQTNPFASSLSAVVIMDGKAVPVIQVSTGKLGIGTTPIGPTWGRHYFLGADSQGRDLMARLLYGGRASLIIAAGATAVTLSMAALIGTVAGYFGGWIDTILSRLLDVLWSFPVFLLSTSIAVMTVGSGLRIGPFTVNPDNLLLPILIIGIVYVPYAARPVRGQVIQLRASEFILASIGLGISNSRILFKDILPNVTPTLLVFLPITMAMAITTESALSFLSIGVQAPSASWGTIIKDGQNLLYTRPLATLAPGIAIALTVLSLNLLGDALRDALDPHRRSVRA